MTIRPHDAVLTAYQAPGGSEDLTDIAIATRPALQRGLCKVLYEISVGPNGNASAVEFTVDGEVFQFPNPIPPGGKDFVQIVREQPGHCEQKKAGRVRLDCGGKAIEINKFNVCVLD